MIFDAYGRAIPETALMKPASGVQIIPEVMSDRDGVDTSRFLTPAEVDRIMTIANGGDIEEQCKLAAELPEKNHDIAHALRTRRLALSARSWRIEPGDDTPEAKSAAERLEKILKKTGCRMPGIGKIASFQKMLAQLESALLPGFAASEIIWKDGASGISGFRFIRQEFFSFYRSYEPRLRVRGQETHGIELPYGKIIFHELSESSDDPVRGGLIRPLAWLHCFSNINLKDLLTFIERYGQPFVVAKVDERSYKENRTAIQNTIRSFGPRGGGVFDRGTEIELLQAANNTGDVYFRLLQYGGDAITKVILGQTASSSDGGGLSGDTAQSEVRHDLLVSDAMAIMDTVNTDLCAVWAKFNLPPATATPRLVIDTEEAEDTASLATTVATLYNAGLEADADEMSDRFGMKLTRRIMPEPLGQFGQSPDLEMSEKSLQADDSLSGALEAWLGPVAEQIGKLVNLSDDDFDKTLEKGFNPEFGSSEALENIEASDMKKEYDHAYKDNR